MRSDRRAGVGGGRLIASSVQIVCTAAAIVSLRSVPRRQARLGHDWRGAGNIGRWRWTSTMVRAAGAWTSWTVVLGCWPADRLVRSSQGLSCDHWPECELGGFLVDWVCGAGLAGARVEIRPGSQTGRFRSRWRDEVATPGLRVDERAQVRSRIEDRHCRRGHARTLGRIEHLRDPERRFGQQAHHAMRGGVGGGVCCAGHTGRVRGILLHPFVRSPHRILEHPAPSHPANPEDPVSGFLLAALRWR